MKFSDERLPAKGDTVVVGMSGGVDSTLAALMLQEKGCRVIGATMSLWDGGLPEQIGGKAPRESCYGPGEEENIAACRAFCEERGMEYHVVDVRGAYRREVLDYFKAEYRSGRTPNPCIRCNRFIKFGALLEGIAALGVDYDFFCTGHYARIVRPQSGLWGTEARPCMVAPAADASKDQTYFLYRIPSDVLEKVRFPLAGLSKREVVALAAERRLAAASRKESQDFIPEEYFDLLFADSPSAPGDIIDLDGRVLGRHRGIERYTVGQRRGLGVSAGRPLYVHSIDAAENLVVLAAAGELDARGLVADDFVWPAGLEPQEPFEALVKIRLASRPAAARIERYEPQPGESFSGTPFRITFAEPQFAVAPGQSAVLYRDGAVVGGGVICRTDGGASAPY